MRKALIIAAVICSGLVVSGCSETLQKAIDWTVSAVQKTNSVLSAIRADAEYACSQIGTIEQAAESAAVQVGPACSKWYSAAVRVRKSTEAICQNLPKLTDNQIGNYVTSVNSQLQGLKGSKPAGC